MKPLAALGCLCLALAGGLAWELMAPGGDVELSRAIAIAPPAEASGDPKSAAPSIQSNSVTNIDARALEFIAATINERPLFASGRRPFKVAVQAGRAVTSGDVLPRLAGVIVGPDGGRAIFAEADGKARTAAVGDNVGRYKIRAIDPGLVILVGSDGTRELRPTWIQSGAPTGSAKQPRVEAATTGMAFDPDAARATPERERGR